MIMSLTVVSCSSPAKSQAETTPTKNQAGNPTQEPASADNPIEVQTSERASPSPTTPPTSTPTVLASCPEIEGYTWSSVFPNETSYITNILPAADGGYVISASVDANDGLWLGRIDPSGSLVWQKKIVHSPGWLLPAPNGNFIVQFENWSLEIEPDGNILKSTDMDRMQPNADGSYTMVTDGQAMQFIDADAPVWSFAIEGVYGEPTMDDGVIYAYSGSYVDQSVYWKPIYTDIKVIKIDGSGQVWQKEYGRAAGIENLDYVETTNDGGAVLAGTHSYEELGSDFDVWLMKINPAGGMSWQTTLASSKDYGMVTDLYELTKGYLLISEDCQNGDMRLIKFSASGAVTWQKVFNSVRGPVSFNTLIDTRDGGLLISGETREMNNVSFMARLNSKGEIVWEKLTGFYGINESPDLFVKSILPLEDGTILIGGGANLLGDSISAEYSAWITLIQDEGMPLGFLTSTPGKFTVTSSMSPRAMNIKDEVVESDPIQFREFEAPVMETYYQVNPACVIAGLNYPTPQSLPSLTPSVTPTLMATPIPELTRDLFLTSPNIHGEDVLRLQQRLLELGYTEVGQPDGIFGGMTKTAVNAFQERNALDVDGYVGKITWNHLFSSLAVPNK